MADNILLTQGSGTTIATDDVAGVHYQINKVAFGPLDTATLVSAGNPLPVTGSVAVTGPLTDTQLRAAVVPVSLASTTITGTIAATQSGTWNISAAADAAATFRGRASSFRTPGRAGTTGQRIFALHNATGSTVVVRINQLTVDLAQTVVKAVTVAPPVIRVHRVTALPTNGTALTKVQKDTALTTNASVTVFGDASADGTSSASALTATIPANSILTQEFAPRLITAAGYEMADRMDFLAGNNIVLRALEGIVVNLDYVLATQNPTTDMWTVTCDWWEI